MFPQLQRTARCERIRKIRAELLWREQWPRFGPAGCIAAEQDARSDDKASGVLAFARRGNDWNNRKFDMLAQFSIRPLDDPHTTQDVGRVATVLDRIGCIDQIGPMATAIEGSGGGRDARDPCLSRSAPRIASARAHD